MTVAVVGAGLAGAVAAARLKDRGVDVVVVADRPGATALHGGGWYVGAGRLPAWLPPRLDEALAFVRKGLAELDLVDGPFTLPDDQGARRVVDLAPAAHAAAAGLPEPFAVADLVPLGHPFARMQPRGEVLPVEYPGWPDAFDRSFAAVAARLDAEPRERVRLKAALERALAGTGFRGVLLPPILGLQRSADLRRELEDSLGLPVAEALGTSPSAPGLRLSGALARWLDRVGVPVRRGRVHRVDPAAGRLETSAGDVRAPAGIVLATGRALPGGLATHEEVREPLAGLPLTPTLPVDLLRAVEPPGPWGGALFRAGVAVDARCRPIGLDGAPIHPRLCVAGDLIGGFEPLADRCASGAAVLTGYLAAEHLAGEGAA